LAETSWLQRFFSGSPHRPARQHSAAMSLTATAVLAATVAMATSQIPTSTGGTMPYDVWRDHIAASPVARRKLASYEHGEEFDKCISIADWNSKTPYEDIDLFDREAAGCCPRNTIPGAPYGNAALERRFGPRVVCGFKDDDTLEFRTGLGEDGYGVNTWKNPEAINTCSFNKCFVIKQDVGCELGGVNFLNGCCPIPPMEVCGSQDRCGFPSGCEFTAYGPSGAYREGSIRHCFPRATPPAWVGTPDKRDDWSDGKLVLDNFERYASCPGPATTTTTTTSGTSRSPAQGCVRISRSVFERVTSLGFHPKVCTGR